MSDDRLPTATLAEWFRGQVDLYQKLLDKSPMLRDDETVRERVQMFRQAADRLEELTAALRPFARWYSVYGEEIAADAVADYRRATELLGKEPTI